MADENVEDRMVRVGDLVDLKWVAAHLGEEPSKVRVWRTRGKLPAPVREFDMGPVWDRNDFV